VARFCHRKVKSSEFTVWRGEASPLGPPYLSLKLALHPGSCSWASRRRGGGAAERRDCRLGGRLGYYLAILASGYKRII